MSNFKKEILKFCAVIVFMTFHVMGFSQFKLSEVYFRSGLTEELEKTKDPTNTLGSAIFPTIPVAVGLSFEKNKWGQSISYEFRSGMITDARLKQKGFGTSASGPNYMHTLEYKLSYKLYNGKSSFLFATAGASITVLPYGFYGMKYDFNDSISSGGATYGSGTATTFEMQHVDAYPTPFNANGLFGFEYQEMFQNNLYISVCPSVTFGLMKYYISSGYFKNYNTNTSGNFIAFSRGSFVGILFKVGYRFPRNEEIDYVK